LCGSTIVKHPPPSPSAALVLRVKEGIYNPVIKKTGPFWASVETSTQLGLVRDEILNIQPQM